MADKFVCIGGNRYKIADDSGTVEGTGSGSSYSSEEQVSSLESKVDKIIDAIGVGSVGGGYRSLSITLPAREKKYMVRLGIVAHQMHIRSDQGLTVNLNTEGGDDIFIDASEFPFSVSELPRNQGIHTVYLTTGTNETTIKILAFGEVL